MRNIALLLAGLVLIVGCENTTVPEETVDPELTQPCENEPTLFDHEQDASLLSAPFCVSEGFLSIWRELVRPFDNSWFIDQISPGLFEVTRFADITGTLFVAWDDSTVSEKELFCHGTRRALVSRPFRGTNGVLLEVSCALVETDGGEVQLTRVEVTAGFGTRIYEDPLEMAEFPEGLLHLQAGEMVSVRVWGPPTDAVVMLRTPVYLDYFEPTALVPMEDYFEGTWHAPDYAGIYRAAVDVLSHDTVYEPTAPYDGIAWIVPYVVE